MSETGFQAKHRLAWLRFFGLWPKDLLPAQPASKFENWPPHWLNEAAVLSR